MGYRNTSTANADFYPWSLADLGLLGVTFHPEGAIFGHQLVSGRIEFVRVRVPRGGSTTGVAFGLSTAGSSLTANQNLLGLYTTSGTKLAETADQSASGFVGTLGQRTAAWSSPVTVASGDYFVAAMSNGTTPAQLRRGDTFASQNGVLTSPLSALRMIRTSGTGNTSLPSSIDYAATCITGGGSWWAGLY